MTIIIKMIVIIIIIMITIAIIIIIIKMKLTNIQVSESAIRNLQLVHQV